MDAETFKNLYMAKKLGASFDGPETAAIVGIPTSKGRVNQQMDIPGFGDDEQVNAFGVFGQEKFTDPAALEASEQYGMAPYPAQMKPPRSLTGKPMVPIPADPTFNREATLKYMPGLMEGIEEGFMPGMRR